MRDDYRCFMAGQAQAYAKRTKERQLNESAVEGLLFADADSCNTDRLEKSSLFYYGMGYYEGYKGAMQ